MRSGQERAIRRALADLGLESITFENTVGHKKMTVVYQGRSKTFTIAGTPRDPHHSVSAIRRDVRRFIRGQYE